MTLSRSLLSVPKSERLKILALLKFSKKAIGQLQALGERHAHAHTTQVRQAVANT